MASKEFMQFMDTYTKKGYNATVKQIPKPKQPEQYENIQPEPQQDDSLWGKVKSAFTPTPVIEPIKPKQPLNTDQLFSSTKPVDLNAIGYKSTLPMPLAQKASMQNVLPAKAPDATQSFARDFTDKYGAVVGGLSNSASLGAGALLNSKINPKMQETIEKQQEENPYYSLGGSLLGYLAPGAVISKGVKAVGGKLLGSKLAPTISKLLPKTDFVGRAASAGLTGLADGGVMGAIEGTNEGIKNNMGFGGTALNALEKGAEFGAFGAGLGAFGSLGKSTFKWSKGDNAWEHAPQQSGNKFIPPETAQGKFDTFMEKPMYDQRLLPAPKPDVMTGYAKDYPLTNNSPLQLGAPQQQLRLKAGAIEAPPSRPVTLGDAPQGKFVTKPTNTNIGSSNEMKSLMEKANIPPTRQNISQLESEITTALKTAENEHYNLLKQQSEKGVESYLKDIKGNSKNNFDNQLVSTSLNNEWYKKAYNTKGKKTPADYDLRNLSKEHLENGYLDDAGYIPPDEYYSGLKKQLKDLQDLKGELGYKSISDFTPQNKTAEPIGKYVEQVKQGQTPNVLPRNNLLEQPKKVYPGEIANINTPSKVLPQYAKESFGQLPTKNINSKLKPLPQAKTPLVESSTIAPNEPSNINSQPTQQNAIQGELKPNTMEEYSNPLTEVNPSPVATMERPKLSNTPMENLPQGESAVKTNTMVNKIPELQTKEGQKFAKDFEATYGIKTDEASVAKANKMLSEDYNGTHDRIMKDGVNSKEDNLAAWQISRDLMAAEKWDVANDFISSIRGDITNHAQIIQSINTVSKDSLEGIAIRGKKLVDSMKSEMQKSSPKEYAQTMTNINNEIKTISDVIGKNHKLLKINLQLFASTVDKELKQAMGKLYNKDYIDSIIKMVDEGKFNEKTISKAVKEKYGMPEFDGTDLKKIADIYKRAQKLDKGTWDYKADMYRIDDYIKSKLPKTVADKISTYQFINLYMNTITPIKILAGNISSATMEHMKDILSASVDNSINFVRGKPMTSSMPSIKTKLQSIKKRTGEVYKDYKNEVETNPFDMSYDFDMKHGLTFKNKFMREAEKITKFILSVSESPFKQAIYDDAIRMKMKSANVSTPTEAMMDEAMEEAQKVMFANRNKATNWAEGFRKGINEVTNTGINNLTGSKLGQKLGGNKLQIKDTGKFGIGNVIQPVIKTPINMVRRSFEYSPLNMLTARNQKDFADKFSKAVIGSVFGLGAGYAGKKAGIITGGIPKDADARNYADDAGRQPYAINAFGKSIDVSYIQPLGMLISAGAEMASDRKDKEWYSPMTAAADSMINQGMLQGFAKLLGQTTINQGSKSSNLLDAVTGGATTMVPFGSLQNQVSKSIDTYKRDTSDDSITKRNLLNRTVARTPARLLLPPKINNAGEKVKEDGLLNTWINPGKVKSLRNDSVTNEIMRLNDQSGETKQFPPKAPGSISYKDSKSSDAIKKELTPSEFTDYQTQLGQANVKAIKEAMDTTAYTQGNDKQKADIISNAMSKVKQDIETQFLQKQGIDEYKSSTSSGRPTRPTRPARR